MAEKQQQKLVVSWFKAQYPNVTIMAIPNAQKFLAKAANIFAMIKSMEAEGFVVGASDLFIAKPVGVYHGLFLEMKDVGKDYKSVSAAQRRFILDMKRAGYHADWAPGFDAAQSIIKSYMGGMR